MNDVIAFPRFLFVDEGVESGAVSGQGLPLIGVEVTLCAFDLCHHQGTITNHKTLKLLYLFDDKSIPTTVMPTAKWQ